MASERAHRRLLFAAAIGSVGLLISAATFVAFRYGVESGGNGLPVMGTLPEFSLVGSNGQPLSHADLSGEIWVADFVFTQCPGLCPLLGAQMAKLQGILARDPNNKVRLVSFSVDPAHDTPEVLRAYADRLHADPGRWLFVTGERTALYSLIGDGFHLAVAERPEGQNSDGEGLITHSDRFVLVDRNMQIRAYYHGTDEDALSKLLSDIKRLDADS